MSVQSSCPSAPGQPCVYLAAQIQTAAPTTVVTTSVPHIYCIGGSTGSAVPNVYFASLSSTGVGTWPSTTSYPLNVYGHSCVAK